MRKILLILFMSVGLFANTQPYKEDIVFNEVTKPTLVQVALDNEIYANSSSDYRDVRLHGKSGVEGYFIRSHSPKHIVNQKRLTATSYDRENGKLTYHFKKPFDVEKIYLNIEDRNFESSVDVYADGKLVLEKQKIFDYSNETGTRNVLLKIPKLKAKEISIVYHLDETTSFYKKYQNLREMSKYLTIKSATFSNTNKAKENFNRTEISTQESSIDEEKKESSYIFKTDNIPFSKLYVKFKEQNFKRSGSVYISYDAKEWKRLQNFTLFASSLSQEKNTVIDFSARIKYIKLVLNNADNKSLAIGSIELVTKPSYLYFLANPNEEYALYFGDKNLTKPRYELGSLVKATDPFVKGKFAKLEKLEVEKVVEEKVSFFEAYKEQLFILAMLLAVGVLGYVAFGLLKRG